MKLVSSYRWFKKGVGFVKINHYVDAKGNEVHIEVK